MLETLRIADYALIEALEVTLREGLNVLTGETGAGKSIIVGALDLVLGARASSDAVRQGASKAKIDAVFRLEAVSPRLERLLKEHDIDIEDGELILSRVVTADGRSRARVSGTPTPVSVLAAIGDELVDLHGQHEHQSLLKPDRQLALLDAFAGTEALAEALSSDVRAWRQVERDLEALEADDREQARRIEFRRFEASDIDAAGLDSGEEEDLRTRRSLITNAERVYALAAQVGDLLYEGEGRSAIDAVDGSSAALEELAGIDGRFQALLDQLAGARSEIEAVATEVRTTADGLEFDAQELETLNARLALIGALKRKYGSTIEEVLAYRDQALEEVAAYDSRDKRLVELRVERDRLLDRARKAAATLSTKRKTAARRLDKRVTATLEELGMKAGRFKTGFDPVDLGADGTDRVTFLLAANPGEDLKPLRQVASGGEISRIMLALKAVFARADRIPTLVFDEIDAGVGGETSTNVARKLRDLAGSHQTICITHLAPIAAAAQSHYHVRKSTRKGRTTTALTPIHDDARIREIARLLDGSTSEVALGHARALLGHD